MNDLRITCLQTDIVWENIESNLCSTQRKLKNLCGRTEIVVLPEMFSTGFTMKSAQFAETINGKTITTLQACAQQYDLAIVGSYIAKEADNSYFNRGFFLSPNEKPIFYDKHHLFRMGHEDSYFKAGNE